MPTLQEVVQNHLEVNDVSIRALAKEAGITYPTLLGVVNRGSVPRKSEHRDALQRILDIDDETWSEVLVASSTGGLAVSTVMTATLQQLVQKKMYARGLTEQQLAEEAGVAYSTVMGITRKGSIPREDSLNRVVDVLGLDPDEVRAAVGASRAIRRGGTGVEEKPETEIVPLSHLVAKTMQSRGQTIGSFAKDLGVGYFTMAKFLDSGTPPSDEAILNSLKKILDLDTESFERSMELSADNPTPADIGPRDELLSDNANPLQEAMVSFMRDNKMTLKSLAKKADLSQVTVSRLVKQGQMPTRATTHLKLQELLAMSPERYQSMINKSEPASAALMSNDSADEYEPTDNYEPQPIGEYELAADHTPPTKDELIALVKKLGPKQRDALKTFLAAMV